MDCTLWLGSRFAAVVVQLVRSKWYQTRAVQLMDVGKFQAQGLLATFLKTDKPVNALGHGVLPTTKAVLAK